MLQNIHHMPTDIYRNSRDSFDVVFNETTQTVSIVVIGGIGLQLIR